MPHVRACATYGILIIVHVHQLCVASLFPKPSIGGSSNTLDNLGAFTSSAIE